jgi:hypothetical protein
MQEMRNLFCLLFLMLGMNVHAQVAISSDASSPDNSAMLEIKSTNQGLLIPRMTTFQMYSITSPAAGLLVYNTSLNAFFCYNVWGWNMLAAGSSAVLQDANANTRVEVEKNPDEDIIRFSLAGYEKMTLVGERLELVNYSENTFLGMSSGQANTLGMSNSAFGANALYANTEGQFNTGIGKGALNHNLTGNYNSGCGAVALFKNTIGQNNTATGSYALYSNISGNDNSSTGYSSLYWNATGSRNTATGTEALYSNSEGIENTATGYHALYANTTGGFNTATGQNALAANVDGNGNTATGIAALSANTSGSNNTSTGNVSMQYNTLGVNNTADGVYALWKNRTGCRNVAVGMGALKNQTFENAGYVWDAENVAVGFQALYNNQPASTITGIMNTAIGSQAMTGNTTGAGNVASGAFALLSNTIGRYNVANGIHALHSNLSGEDNVAMGADAMWDNTLGSDNTAVGTTALFNNVSGDGNTAIGHSALLYCSGNYNTALGYSAGFGINSNTCVGAFAGNTGHTCGTFLGYNANVPAFSYTNCMALGYNSLVDASNKVVIGNTSVISIGGFANWSNLSDGRYKKNVNENVPGLAFITLLKPLTYNLDMRLLNADINAQRNYGKNGNGKEGDFDEDVKGMEAKEKIVYSGFVAQDVEKAAKALGYDFSGVDAPQDEHGHYGLRYAEFVVPLVKAVQEQQQMIEELRKQNEQLVKRLEILESKSK